MGISRKRFFDSAASPISPFWRGQLFLFDQPKAPTYSSRDGLRLLVVFLFLEGIVRPLPAGGARRLSIAERDWWALMDMSLLTALVCWLVIRFASVHPSQLGLYSWFRWSKTEKFYLLQIVPIAIVVFSFFVSARLKALWARPNLWEIGLFIFVPKMIWGFYQEFLYRGMLQTELVRRWGARTGILVSNLIFTFGPLHAYHFRAAQVNPSHLWIFAATFAIGLFFALIFRRSGNLWIVGSCMACVTGSLMAWPKFREWQAKKNFHHPPPECARLECGATATPWVKCTHCIRRFWTDGNPSLIRLGKVSPSFLHKWMASPRARTDFAE